MPIELETGQVQLTIDEQQMYAPAAELLSTLLGRALKLTEPMAVGDFVDLLFAKCVVERDEDTLRQMEALLGAELASRERPN
jgi:hypothetical protein